METSSTITFLEASIGVDNPDALKNDYEYYAIVTSRLARLRAFTIKHLDELGLFAEETPKMGVAIEEAQVNAAMHGNLERSSDLRDSDDRNAMVKDLEAKCNTEMHTRSVSIKVEMGLSEDMPQPELEDITIKLTAETGDAPVNVEVLDQFSMKVVSDTIKSSHIQYVRFIIEDEGKGFKPEEVPDPRQPENLAKAHGRGLLLMRSFMDAVEYSEGGRRVELRKNVESKA